MVRSMIHRLKRGLLVWLVLQPLAAQVDSRLITNTDLLDVYTRTSTPANPEVMMVLDFSTSMLSVAWHPSYLGSTKGTTNSHNPEWGQTGDADGLVPMVRQVTTTTGTGNNAVSTYSYDIVFVKGRGFPLGSGTVDLSSLSSVALTGGTLLKADGSSITLSGSLTRDQITDLITGGEQNAGQGTQYPNAATHVRISRTYGGITRQVDIPLPWRLFDSPSVVPSTAVNYSTSSYLLPNKTNVANPGATQYFDSITYSGLGGSPYPTLTGASNNNARFQTVLQDASTGGTNWVDPALSTSGAGSSAITVSTTFYKIGLFHYNADYLWWVFFGTDVKNSSGTASTDQGAGNFVIPASSPSTSPWSNGLPALTRSMMLKRAVCQVTVNTYDKIWWGFRFLDMSGDTGGITYSSSSSTDFITANSAGAQVSSPEPSRKFDLLSFTSGGKYVFSDLNNLAVKMPLRPQTPLTYAAGNTFAQMTETSSNNPFSSQRTDSTIPPCRKSFVVFFTDGAADEPSLAMNADPYGSPYGSSHTGAGGDSATSLSSILPGGSNFNIWTIAGTAAFGHNPPGNLNGKSNLSDGVPFWVTSRPTGVPRKVRTMTIGMSLSGTLDLSNPSSNSSLAPDARSKWDLYRAALYGNPDSPGWGPTLPNPFNWQNNPTNQNPKVNPFFFDTQGTQDLETAMNNVVQEVLRVSSELSAPATPLVGLSLGKQVYLGVFQSQISPRWNGDLLMAQITINPDNSVSFKDKTGAITATITSSNAIWSARNNLIAAGWDARTLYTYVGNSNPTSPQTLVTLDSLTAAQLGVPDTTTRDAVVRFMKGANSDAQADSSKTGPTYTRSDVLGDIISSSPAALEYDLSLIPSGSNLASFAASHSTESGLRFRIVFVGTNHGVLHAFGEVSYVDSTGTVQAEEQELWAFIPPDFLPYLNDLRLSTGNFSTHRYMLDGSPTLYFKDLPTTNSTGALTSTRGDGKVNGNEKAYVIFGLGKGGRSIYSLNIDKDHVSVPALQWQLLPATPASGASISNIYSRMGLSTSQPAIGRVITSDATTPVQDFAFVGGGLSTGEIDARFSSIPLGRSIVGIPVDGGPFSNLAQAWDIRAFSASSGSVNAAVVPFEVFAGSSLAQRVYFSDRGTGASGAGGTLWALGSTTLAATAQLRIDNSNVSTWNLRKVFHAPDGNVLSTAPTPFTLATTLPITRTDVSPSFNPSAVGIIVGTGDRNNPLDNDTTNQPIPAGSSGSGYNQLVVVFDRQDSSYVYSNSTGATKTANLKDLTTVSSISDSRIVPGNTQYYIDATHVGYTLDFPAGSTQPKSSGGFYYAKSLNNSSLIAGVMFFSVFKPSANIDASTCAAQAVTDSYRICNVLAPIYNSGTTSASAFDPLQANCSGKEGQFTNLAGEITALGTTLVIQGGQATVTDPNTGVVTATADPGTGLQGFQGNPAKRGMRARSWRIVR